jgi:hypothetical protein
MGSIALNDTKAKHWRGIVVFAIRIVGGVAAVGSFLVGLWSVWGDPGQGVSLMGLGIVLGVIFGRYPAATRAALAPKKPDAG